MSETVKKSMEINSLLEETEDLSIGAGATAAGNLIVSSAITTLPRVSINICCLTVVTRDSRCLIKPVLR